MEEGSNLLIEEGTRPVRSRWLLAGWTAFAVVVLFLGLFGYKFWFYYSRLRRGESVELPQYAGKITRAIGGADAAAAGDGLVDRAAAEGSGFAAALGVAAKDRPKLTVVEFADFGCPYSKEASPAVGRMLAKYGDRVRLVYRDYPIPSLHPDAPLAASAARCAGDQGKFWAYHDQLYANASLDADSLVTYAKSVGLDADAFQKCLTSGAHRREVDADIALGTTLGVSGTPTFFFNGIKVEGSVPEDVMEQVIKTMTAPR